MPNSIIIIKKNINLYMKIQKVVNFLKDPIYINSIYYMSSTFILGILGFVFWIIVAKLFQTQDIGIATALISVATFLISVSSLGFNISLIHYLPKSNNREELISSSVLFVILTTALVSLIFIFGLSIFSPKLIFIQSNALYVFTFVIFVIFLSLNSLIESIFIALRGTKFILVKNTILSILKLIIPFLIVFLGAYGIFSSFSLSTLIATVIGFLILYWKYSIKPSLRLNYNLIKEMSAYSAGNYLAGFLYQAPLLLMPILILNKLGSIYSAYFYISTMILSYNTSITDRGFL